MFTNFESAQLRREALSSGLSAIVSKDESIAALGSSIQSLLEPVSLDRACKSPRNTFSPTKRIADRLSFLGVYPRDPPASHEVGRNNEVANGGSVSERSVAKVYPLRSTPARDVDWCAVDPC